MASMESQSASSASAASSTAGGPQPQYFVDSTKGNIKEVYSFQQKLANGGFGIVYLAEHRESHEKYAIKAIQKKKLKDYTTFINEINILKVLVSCRKKLFFKNDVMCKRMKNVCTVGSSEYYKVA